MSKMQAASSTVMVGCTRGSGSATRCFSVMPTSIVYCRVIYLGMYGATWVPRGGAGMAQISVKQGAVRKVPIGGDREAPRQFWVEVKETEGRPNVRLDFEVRAGAVQCRGVQVHSAADGREVQASDLRGLRVQD